jgi:hypothetical protein
VFALTPNGIAQISTPGNADIPIEVGATSFVSNDPAVSLSLATGNLVATASGPSASLEISDDDLKAAVTTEDGQTVEVNVTPESPAAKIVANAESGGIEVLTQAANGIVERRDIASDGSETVSIETAPLNLSATTWEAPPGLESVALPMLPSPDARNVNNPDYAVDTAYTPPADAVPATTAVPVTTAAPATTAPPTTVTPTTVPRTTVPRTTVPRTTVPPTTVPPTTVPPTTVPPTTVPPTTVPRTTVPPTTVPPTTVPPTAPPPAPTTTTTTVPPVIQPALNLPVLPNATYGDGPIVLLVISPSPAPIQIASSNTAEATVTSSSTNSASITLVGAGTSTITASQAAVTGFAAANASTTLTIDKAQQAPLVLTTLASTPGTPVTLISTGGTGTGTTTYQLSPTGTDCTLEGTVLNCPTPGTCTVIMENAGDANHRHITTTATVSFVSVMHGDVSEGQRLTLNAPSGMVFSSVVFASYGTPTGTGGNYSLGDCHAADSTTIVSNSALAQSTVSIDALNDVFKDPCSGTGKRLAVSLGLSLRLPDAASNLQHTVTDELVNLSWSPATGSGATVDGYQVRWRITGSDAWTMASNSPVVDTTITTTITTVSHTSATSVLLYEVTNPRRVAGAGHGSFQVHDVTDPGTGSTMLAWNAHGDHPLPHFPLTFAPPSDVEHVLHAVPGNPC